MLFHQTREFFIPKGALKVSDKTSDAVAYLYAGSGARPCAMVFVGKQSKPVARYSFKSEARREAFVRSTFASRQAVFARARADAAARKNFVNPFKVGDVLNTCWGYDQTNREFFEVIEVKPKSVVLRELAQETTIDGGMSDSGKCVPLVGQYVGQPFMRLVTRGSVKIDECRRASKTETIQVGPVAVYAPQSYSWGH